MYKIYKYTFPDGKIYIGMTKNSLEERRDMGYQHNKNLQAAIREVGWNGFKHEILCSNMSKEEAFTKESEYISKYDSTNPQKGYNISYGGKATFEGLKHTEEYKKKMSNLYKGRSFSDETLQRMRDSHAKERKPIIRIDDNGNIKKYESQIQAAKDISGYPTNIMRACREHKKYKNFRWEYATLKEVMVGETFR